MLKTLHILGETDAFNFSGLFDRIKQHLFENVCTIIDVFTATFAQFNASLNKSVFFITLTLTLLFNTFER